MRASSLRGLPARDDAFFAGMPDDTCVHFDTQASRISGGSHPRSHLSPGARGWYRCDVKTPSDSEPVVSRRDLLHSAGIAAGVA